MITADHNSQSVSRNNMQPHCSNHKKIWSIYALITPRSNFSQGRMFYKPVKQAPIGSMTHTHIYIMKILINRKLRKKTICAAEWFWLFLCRKRKTKSGHGFSYPENLSWTSTDLMQDGLGCLRVRLTGDHPNIVCVPLWAFFSACNYSSRGCQEKARFPTNKSVNAHGRTFYIK